MTRASTSHIPARQPTLLASAPVLAVSLLAALDLQPVTTGVPMTRAGGDLALPGRGFGNQRCNGVNYIDSADHNFSAIRADGRKKWRFRCTWRCWRQQGERFVAKAH